ncbi:MAG TPA: hypothetical protein VHY75_01365 [Steroidobacteraceae bacterium]|jgi:uncharacterized membrane protein YqjE|nr:hypothetical protein [Steroidobacteraceae bacterium]
MDPGIQGKAGMTHSSNARANIIAFLAILALSALTMVWLFWHHPVKTLIATLAVLAALGISARLARSIETDAGSELKHGNQGF